MGMSKKDLSRKKQNLKSKLEQLEKKAKMDPMHRNKTLWAEINEIKKKLSKY